MNSLLLTPISCPLPEIETSIQSTSPSNSRVNEMATQIISSSQSTSNQSTAKKLKLDQTEAVLAQETSPQETAIDRTQTRPNISECFKNGRFDIITYNKMVTDYVENLPKECFDENLFNEFLSSNIKIPENNEERKIVLDSIMKIISTAPGKELIRRMALLHNSRQD